VRAGFGGEERVHVGVGERRGARGQLGERRGRRQEAEALGFGGRPTTLYT
jgi:hypothetical protein